jgi:hypothetical protein
MNRVNSQDHARPTPRTVEAAVADILGVPDKDGVWYDFKCNGGSIRVRKGLADRDAAFVYARDRQRNCIAGDKQSYRLEREATFYCDNFIAVRYALKQGKKYIVDARGTRVFVLKLDGLLNGDVGADWDAANDNADELARIIEGAPGSFYAAEDPSPKPPPEPNGGLFEASDSATPELTLFVNARGALTKQYTLDANGNLVKTEGGQMAAGTATRIAIGDAQALAELIGTISSNQALALGSMRTDLLAQVTVTTKKALNSGNASDIISRSRDYLTFSKGRRGFCLGDFDCKGITAEVRDKLEQSGGFVAALETVIPELKNAGYVVRASTSAGLFRTDTGQRFADSGGIHLYLGIKDVSDSERFLKALFDRCWLMELSWYTISAAGTLLARSIIDRTVATPEHLCFEGPPLLGPGLAQDKAARMPKVVNGDWLDTRAACPPLTAIEQSRLKELQTKAAFALNAECARVRMAWLQQRTTEIATRCGITEQAAHRIAIKHADGVLLPAVELTFADPAIGIVTVGDVLADPDKYVDEPLADPWEGPSYGRQTAKVLRRPDGSIFVNSFAHGGQTFELKFDAEAINKILQETATSNVVETMINHVLTGSLDEVETDALVKAAAKTAKAGLRPVQQKLKQARIQYEKQRNAQMRAVALANRVDPRPQHDAPLDNAPWLPEMEAYDAILGAVTGDIPPTRHIEDELNCVRCTVVPGTHAFSSDGSDDAVAPQWNIFKLDNCDVANLLEKHIDFIDMKEGYSVQCPPAFVNHYRQWHDSTLPKLVAISPLPLVLGNGEILAPRGLNRLRGIAFIIDDKLRQCLPSGRICDNAPVATALDFLLNDWLVDVSCSFTDKCTAIALALTMIERSLLGERPVGFIDAPSAESGKTVLAKMLVAAVTGTEAATASWSPNEEERRKALLAYFDAGLIYIFWDNIPDGALISCPHLERSCTTSYYADRKLGVSEVISAAAATIHLFTGVNIAPRGALASRSLRVRVDTNLVDPMARTFVHNNPVSWTKANRERILGALYTILLGNPMLDLPADAPTKTRFPMWYRLVGSAVEHAAASYKEANLQDDKAVVVDFGGLFLKQKTSEEEGTNLGETLNELDEAMRHWLKETRPASLHKGEFTAKDLASYLNNATSLGPENTSASASAETIRGFLFQKIPAKAKLSPRVVGIALAAYVDRWRAVDTKKLVLRLRPSHKTNVYRVDRAPV